MRPGLAPVQHATGLREQREVIDVSSTLRRRR